MLVHGRPTMTFRIPATIAAVALLTAALPADAQHRRGGGGGGGVVVGRSAPRVVGRPVVVAPVRFYRPYYTFRPRLNIGFGLWSGYPIVYPAYYGYYNPFYYGGYYTNAYSYGPYSAYPYTAYPYPAVPYPASAYPGTTYPANPYPATAYPNAPYPATANPPSAAYPPSQTGPGS